MRVDQNQAIPSSRERDVHLTKRLLFKCHGQSLIRADAGWHDALLQADCQDGVEFLAADGIGSREHNERPRCIEPLASLVQTNIGQPCLRDGDVDFLPVALRVAYDADLSDVVSPQGIHLTDSFSAETAIPGCSPKLRQSGG
ncbi:MAG: hypothetical protein WBC04_06215 [Candidatus Acidiferrales bacterium]